MANEEVRGLVIQRGQIKAQITRFTTYVDEFDHDNFFELELRLEKIDQLWKDFNVIQSKIECLDASETQLEYRDTLENSYFAVVSQARKLIAAGRVVTSSQVQVSCANDNNSNNSDIKLPVISVLTFQADYREWSGFFDTFSYNNKSLSSVQKFHYLRDALKGEAKQVIDSLEISNENYKTALHLLKARFDNKKLIKKAHIASLFNMAVLTKKSYIELRKFLDEFINI